MTQAKGIDWQQVTFVVGHREDMAPATLPEVIYRRHCGNCGAATITEAEYPLDVPLLCNVCAAALTADIEGEGKTQLLFDLPAAVKARLLDMAYDRGVPIEEVLNDFLDWKLGRTARATFHASGKKHERK